MPVHESSSELNPTLLTAQPQQTPKPQEPPGRTAKDYFALAIATCGVGYFPLAPGTWGSLLALAVYFLIRWSFFGSLEPPLGTFYSPVFFAIQFVVIAVVTAAGIWAGAQTEAILKVKDPGKIVIDEVAGQLIAVLPVPLAAGSGWAMPLILAFLLFRFFDIVKPYPARRLESLRGGFGVMTDDLVAGAYAAVVVALVVGIRSLM
jgi:phosphatidylglycerophosphatase A